MKTVLITGASRGIGRAAAQKFQKEGYELYLICHRDVKELQDLRGHHYAGDVGDPAFIKGVMDEIESLDVLVNNAGIAYYGLLQDMSLTDWDSVIRTNLTSMFLTCKEAIPKMLRKGSGKIINLSSIWGGEGAALESAYSASKGGVDAFTKALAKELAPSNIQVNALAPGVIDTDMNSNLTQKEKEKLISEIPADRLGTVEEAAELIFFLAEGNEYLTGQIIGLNGGWS